MKVDFSMLAGFCLLGMLKEPDLHPANTPHEKPFIFQLSGAVSLLTGQSSTWLEREREGESKAQRGGGPGNRKQRERKSSNP